MRKIRHGADRAPLSNSQDSADNGLTRTDSGRLTDDDRIFLNLLKKYHREKKYKYMHDWWSRIEQPRSQ